MKLIREKLKNNNKKADNLNTNDENVVIKESKPILVNILKKVKCNKNKNITFKAIALFKFIRYEEKYDLNKLKLFIDSTEIPIKFKFKHGIPFIKKYFFNYYEFTIPMDKIHKFDIQNKLILQYEDKVGRIVYNIFDLKKGKNRNSKIFVEDSRSIYFRQTAKNTMYLTIREENKYDKLRGRLKIAMAYYLSKLYLRRNIILLYEKESSRYEESASVLYEKLIDEGYKNCYYIINKNNKALESLDKKYLNNIIYKDTLKHLIYFFKCNKFIGTETIGHALQLRIANRKVLKKMQSKNINYVFLQHGVMYMISLDSDLRTGFRNTNYKTYRIVTSSKLETEHFIELGGFQKENLYITGLAKFDKSILNKDADKIVIMPTWRRWEANLASYDFSKTKYYKMIVRIVNCIPKELMQYLVILPHPLMIKSMQESDCELKKYLPKEVEYNEILKKCKLLITDYSSISYDAFYRGSNIIFYWEEKEECLKQYGENSKLMLTEQLAFGDVCYNQEELKKVIDENYHGIQKKEFKDRYKKIVEFDDGKNTDRIIENLIKDGLIKKR